MSKKIIHPLYLAEVEIKDNKYKLNTIPLISNENKIIYISKSKNENTNKNNIQIASIYFNNRKLLEFIYNIKDWVSLEEYLKVNINNNIKNTIDRIFNYCWVSFYDKYKYTTYSNYIVNSYKLYFQVFDIKYSYKEFINKFYKIKKLNIDLNKIHKFLSI